MSSRTIYRVVADGPLAPTICDLLGDRIELLPWTVTQQGSDQPVDGVYTYGHPLLDGTMLDRLPGVKVISNYAWVSITSVCPTPPHGESRSATPRESWMVPPPTWALRC